MNRHIMKYSKEEIYNLIEFLRTQKDFKVLTDLFEDFYNSGYFSLGFSIPGQENSEIVINKLQIYFPDFPDVLYALFMPKKNLPLFIQRIPKLNYEYAIASWRLSINK